MATNQYRFITHWHMKAQKDNVIAIFHDAESLPRWWPAVYLDVRVLASGDENGIGKRIALYTKGWLPYTLRWDLVVTEVSPDGPTLVAEGDFVGRGIWTFVQNDQWLKITYDWEIEAEKPLLKYFSFALKPFFAMNHQWAMKQGERSLELELRRRAGEAGVPEPPPATPRAMIPWVTHVLTRSSRKASGGRCCNEAHPDAAR